MKLTDQEFIRIVNYIKDTYGINLSQKRLLIEGRLAYTVSSMNFNNFNDFFDAALKDKNSDLYNILISKLTTNHTYFMRENEHFDFFMNVILPQLEKTVLDHDVRIWSAGCSFGNEPYNLAMCIDEYFGERKADWDMRILATDISARALTAAKQGIYKASELEDIPPHWKTKYFTKVGDDQYKVVDKIRKEVVFKYFNLMEDFEYKKPFDLILCRNVMIYFDAKTRNKLVEKFYEATKIGGYFFIGHAEHISKESKYKIVKPSIFIK